MSVAEEAHQEWDYRKVESQFFDRKSSVSIPCQLEFVGETDQDTQRFHSALKKNGFSKLDSEPDRSRKGHRPYYDGEVCLNDSYHRIGVLVFRGGVVRLYPHDEYVPTVEELNRLIEALKTGFGAELEHSPIQRKKES